MGDRLPFQSIFLTVVELKKAVQVGHVKNLAHGFPQAADSKIHAGFDGAGSRRDQSAQAGTVDMSHVAEIQDKMLSCIPLTRFLDRLRELPGMGAIDDPMKSNQDGVTPLFHLMGQLRSITHEFYPFSIIHPGILIYL